MKKSYRYPLKKRKRDTRGLAWKFVYHNFYPATEGLREALCTVGNGYFGTRGASPESSASRVHYAGTYFAGVYNTLASPIAGKVVSNEDLVNCPNWLYLTFRTEKGRWVVPSACKVLDYRQEIDMYRGLVSRTVRFRTKDGYTFTVEDQRIAHMGNPHLAALRYMIASEDYNGILTVRSGLDGTVENKGVARYRQLRSKHLKPHSVGKISGSKIHLSVMTSQSKIIISQTAMTRIFCGGRELRPKSSVIIREKKAVYQDFRFRVRPGREYEIEKTVSLYTSNDRAAGGPRAASLRCLRPPHTFGHLLKTHEKAWATLWKTLDITIQGNETFNKILRFHTFHLVQSCSRHNVNLDAGLPARGLHGEAYRGHIFWDQLFVMPFYNLHAPEISKALLLYRYRRLDQARKNAAREGFQGAMFPWQSASLGDEQTQSIHLNPMSGKWEPDHSRIQRHISFDIAYNVYRYWQQTRDAAFMNRYGAEMLLSIAQFGSSLSRYDARDGRYHTDGLMGPDEFHEKYPGASHPGFKDNAFTNFMIVATMWHALEAVDIVPQRVKKNLLKRLAITDEELARWKDITRKMNIIFKEDGVISQFKGYFRLRELDWDKYRKKYANIHRMDRILKAEGKSPNDYKVAKQADALMLFYLFTLREIKVMFKHLGYGFDRRMFRKNYDYYVKRTSHGSTLSKVVYCYLAHVLGREAEAWHTYLEVLKSDIHDIQGGTTPEGIHCGVMGASIDIAIRSFAGVNIFENHLKLTPYLPENWQSIKLRFLYQGKWVLLRITRRQINIYISTGRARRLSIPVEIYGTRHLLAGGRMNKIRLERGIPMIAKEITGEMGEKKVLIVHGDIMQGMILKTRLEALGYLVDYTRRGTEALGMLKTGWVDLVITAVALDEGMSGYQLFKEIRKRKEYVGIPVMVVCKKPGMKGMFEKMGAEAFFARPYSIDMVIKEAQRSLKGAA